MQSNNYVEAKDILSATNGGLDIIFQLYPQAIGSEIQKNRKFKIRGDEKSASASLKQAEDGNWLVTDFGGDSQPRNAIMCFMEEKGLDWVSALRRLAVDYNVVSEEKQAQLIRATYSEAPAAPDQLEGTWSWDIRNNFSDTEIETIISKNVLSAMSWKKPVNSTISETGKLSLADEERIMAPYNKIKAAFQLYNWHPLVSYSIVKNRKVMTFSATDQYPIFLIDEGTHQKIYQPKNPDKSHRFMYAGSKPKDFIHGLDQLTKTYNARKKRLEADENDAKEMDLDEDPDDGKKGRKKESPKVDDLILCSGGSDAINLAILGYHVIWLNSETAKLSHWQYDKIMIMVEKFYQLQDIDNTGKKSAHALAMDYLDLYTIELPNRLRRYKDSRNNECKDVRDYLNHFTRKDFKQLVEFALPYRFWEKKARYEGRGNERYFAGYDYDFDNVQAYNFLLKNGFGRIASGDKKTEWMYIRRIGNIVYEQHPNDIKNFIHDFLRERLHDKNLRNAMFRTTQLNEGSLSNLEVTTIDFSDSTADSQFVFFLNKTVEVRADEIIYHKGGTVDRYIWEEDLLKHNIEPVKQAPFTITRNDNNEYDIEINDTKCPFLKYLVQTSRVHWRKELEDRLGGELFKPADVPQYLKDNHCTIAGENLTHEEIAEQKAHLINKIFSIGYLLHRYKARNKAWFVWGMDNKINEDGKSHGGSGKSILFDMAMRTMMPKNFYMNGRNPKLTEDAHKYDGLTEHHRYILVDDAHEYIKLDAFYTDITGDIKVNPKGKQPYSIPFNQGGKFAFTTNYTPRDVGPSTERRMVYCVFSDYYHNKGETDDYRELRDPVTDLGLTLFTDFNQEQWNSFYNLMLYCLNFFLGTEEKMRPAMENVNKRNSLSVMGNLHEWALVYYSEQSGRLDTFTVREEAFTDYCVYNGKKISPQLFASRLKEFCRYYGYVFNPKEFQDKFKKIIRKVEPKMYVASTNTFEPVPNAPKVTKEMFYIQTKNELEGITYDEKLPEQGVQGALDMEGFSADSRVDPNDPDKQPW